jgi:hypothetical protein
VIPEGSSEREKEIAEGCGGKTNLDHIVQFNFFCCGFTAHGFSNKLCKHERGPTIGAFWILISILWFFQPFIPTQSG